MYKYLGVVYHVQPATEEMEQLIVKDKFIREEVHIPAVSRSSITGPHLVLILLKSRLFTH